MTLPSQPQSLGERVLAEHLSGIDPYEFADIHDLRSKLLEVIDDYIEIFHEPGDAMPGDEFYDYVIHGKP